MNRGALILSTLGLLAFVMLPAPAPIASTSARLYAAAADTAPAVQQKGRYKKGNNDDCVWDANDSGPNQCTPRVRGRFKKGANDACAWDANDSGPDQCRPAKGRWKKGGDNSCAWDANDGGPDQCNPRQPR